MRKHATLYAFTAAVLTVGILIGCSAGSHNIATGPSGAEGSTPTPTLANHTIPGGALLPAKQSQTQAASGSWHLIEPVYAQTQTQPQIVMSFDGYCQSIGMEYWDPSGFNGAQDALDGNVIYGLGDLSTGGKCAPDPQAIAPGVGSPVAGAGTLSTFKAYSNGGGNGIISIFVNGVYQGSPCQFATGQKIATCDDTAAYPVNDGDTVEATLLMLDQNVTDGAYKGLQNIHLLFGKS